MMKMGDIMPRAGIEPTSLTVHVSVLTIIPCRLLSSLLEISAAYSLYMKSFFPKTPLKRKEFVMSLASLVML